MTDIETIELRAYVACLSCYSEGVLVGHWYDAEVADEASVADVHRGSGRSYASCEELSVIDHENIPVSGDMDPMTAAEWGRCIGEVDEHLRPALLAWVRSGSYVAEGTGDLPSLPDFEERYEGEWCSWREYADHLLEEGGLLEGVSDEVRRYIDYDQWARDLLFDYTVEHCDDGGVYVFRDL